MAPLSSTIFLVSGSAGILVGFPLDTVKVRIQTQCMLSGTPKYTGTFQCLSTIIKHEGVRCFIHLHFKLYVCVPISGSGESMGEVCCTC